MGKFIKVLAAILVIACGVWAQTIDWLADSITVKTPADFRELAIRTNNGDRNGFRDVVFILVNNIFFESDSVNQWIPIGTHTRPFDGRLEGNLKLISGNIDGQLLFGTLGKNGRLRNVRITDNIKLFGERQQAEQPQRQVVAAPTYKSILTEAGLSEYIPLFEEHRITEVDMIRALTNEEFREMGITIGDRRRITEAFAKTQSQQQESQTAQMQALKEPISLHPVFRRMLVEGGLGEYVHILERYGIANIKMLRSLTREQLKEMGIEAMFDQIAKLGAKGVQRGAKAIRR